MPKDLRTGGIAFDQDGTLWGVQSLVNTPLYSINTEGVFTAYSLSPGANAVALKDVVTSDGAVFMQSRTNGIYGYTETNGVAVKRQIRSGVGNGDLPSDKVLSMAVDQDGELWIGTDEGLAVIYSPENVFDGTGSRDARPILFEEDGVVQKLLGDNPVSAIRGRRKPKWLGTRGAGLFLVSPDGLRTLHQFTAENSPLLSNTINSIASDPTTGRCLLLPMLALLATAAMLPLGTRAPVRSCTFTPTLFVRGTKDQCLSGDFAGCKNKNYRC